MSEGVIVLSICGCELRMHVCDWETNCFFEDNFFGKGQKSFKTTWVQTALGVREGRRVEQEGKLFFSRSPNLDHGS